MDPAMPAPANASGDANSDPVLGRIREQVRSAQAERRALCIRGGGSKDFYGGAPSGELLDTRELTGICSYEPTEMVITARAGTPLAQVEDALAEYGQCLAFEPPRFSAASTLGGVIAAGLAGPARASAGAVRDFVLGATMINGQAQLLQFGGQVMKNVAGYDVSRVLAGSLGVLGVICEVSLKVPPVPVARASLRFACEQAQAILWLQQWAAAALPISASAWQQGTLHLRLAGARAAVQSGCTALAGPFGGSIVDEAEAAGFWSDLRDQSSGFFAAPEADGERLWRLSLPASHPPLELPGATLVEWGGAQRWLRSALGGEQIREAAARAGGHASVYRAAVRAVDFLPPLPAPMERIQRALKQAFDPAGIFNPGRLYSWL